MVNRTSWGAFRSLSVGGVGVTHPHLNFKTTQPGEDTHISRRFIPRRPVTSLSCADIGSLQVVMKYPVSVSFRINIYTLLCFLCTLRCFLFTLRCVLFTLRSFLCYTPTNHEASRSCYSRRHSHDWSQCPHPSGSH